MRHLTLMRHAKAKQPSGDMTDHQRPLNKRGVRQAEAMAHVLQRWQALEGKMCVSTAVRTRQTFDVIEAQHLERQLDSHVLLDDALYTFEGEALLAWLKALPTSIERVLLIGHNPALVELAHWLNDEAPPSLPTGSVLHFTLPDTPWHALEKGSAELAGGLMPETASYALFKRRAAEPPSTNSDTASRLHEALTYQFERVKALKPGVMAGVDPEFLHQYRVSLRRSRAMLESLRAITKVPGLKKRLKQLKQHASATSDLRDLDVFLEEFNHTEPPLSASAQQRLRQWLQDCHRVEHTALCQQLNAPGYLEALEEWQRWLASETCEQALGTLSSKRIQAVLDERLVRHHEDVAALSLDSPDEAFHELRKGVKRIRYLADLHPTTSKALLAGLKQRQRLLGGHQDLCVRQAWLEAFNVSKEGTPEERQECARWQAALEAQKQTLRKKVLSLKHLCNQ
ncbi:CHAD domain-containing protein [Halomonas sp. LY9]